MIDPSPAKAGLGVSGRGGRPAPARTVRRLQRRKKCLIKVQQKRSMTVILADEVKLTLEHAVACHIGVVKAVCEIPG
ncbi:MAG: hypothetical protein WBO95_07300 [Candidatus Dechloromonas phosphoritropha]